MFVFDCYSAKTTRRREQVLADGHNVAQTTSIVVWAQGIFLLSSILGIYYDLSFLFFN